MEVVLHDQRSVLTVCTPAEDVEGVRDVTASLPRLVGGRGIVDDVPTRLSEPERAALAASARVIREAIDALPAS